ncbi:MAG TPA: Trk family potassium uptake protein, partial [Clostridiales bacterium]|nr:Trk family potassium uptake protein [Clostridiales bacterium]
MQRSIRKALTPLRVIVLAFTLLIVTGTLLLNLPVASRSGISAGWLTSLFTATSASCVTGLVLVDTATHWSIFGQVVILLLIQTGGLGIVTLSVFFISLMGRKVKLKEMLMIQESLNHFSFGDILKVWKKVVGLMFVIELVGALMLSIRFIPEFGPRGIFVSIFHAVSAFCNAGFDILGTPANPFASLTGYISDPLVTLTIAFLIILGGLGYIIWQDLLNLRKEKRLSYHSRVMLIFTCLLLVTGTLLFLAVEQDNPATMADLSLAGKLHSSFFQSVTSRTAGFNTIDQTNMNVLSKIITVFLMFIGGGSGSTAGGVKVTTMSVLLFAIISQI